MIRLFWNELAVFETVVPLLIVGATLFLGLGCLLVRMTRSPVHQQRLGEIALASVLAWSILACVPLPRLLPEWRFFDNSITASAASLALPTAQRKVEVAISLPAANEVGLFLPAEVLWTDAMTVPEPASRGPSSTFENSLPPGTDHPALSNQIEPSLVVFSQEPEIAPDAELRDADSISGAPAGDWVVSTRILWQFYLAGTAACCLWLVVGQFLLWRIRRRGNCPEPWLAELYQSLVLPGGRTAKLIVSDHCHRALSWGLWSPVIVLPRRLCRRQNHGQVRTVLLHELGHVSQCDAWGNFLTCLALPLLYLHPCFWWLRIQIRLAAELVADDWAAQRMGKVVYVEDLVALARVSTGRGIPLPGVTGVLSSPSQFYRRMNMLLAREQPLATRPTVGWRLACLGTGVLAVVIATGIAGIRPAVGYQDATPAAPSATPMAPSGLVVEPTPATPSATAAAPTATNEQPAAEPAPTASAKPPTTITEISGRVVTETASKLDAERAELRSQLLRIERRLKELNVQSSTGIVAESPYRVEGVTGKTVTIATKSEQGLLQTEVWTVDDTGKPDKLVARYTSASKTVPPVTTLPKGPGVIFSEVQTEDGIPVVRQFVVDGRGEKRELKGTVVDENGRPQRLTPVPSTGIVVGSGKLEPVEHTTAAPVTAIRMPAGLPGRQPPIEPQGAGQQLDLVSLATSYADAVGAVESAKVTFTETEALFNKAVVSERELSVARINLQNAERKATLLKRIAMSAATALKNRVGRLKQTSGPESSVIDAESHLEILNQILETSTPETPKAATPAQPATTPAAK